MGRVTVVGLGPAGPELLTVETRAAIDAHRHRFLRTRQHPAAVAVEHATSFDEQYERASTLEEVYAGIVDALAAASDGHEPVLYAVPGSPAVAERTVELLLRDPRVDVQVLPALSCLDLAWVRLGIDPLAASVRVVDGRNFSVDAAGEPGPLLILQCDQPSVLSEIKLAVEDPPSEPVVVLQRLGLPDESVASVAWDDLDRIVTPDHLTSIYVPTLSAPVGRELIRFAELVRTLRERCPWDREQTHESLTRHLLEETYEVLEAIENLGGEPSPEAWDHLCEELGDLLFQVYFHATLAAEEGQFTLADVARGVHDKLVRRHPHVFGATEAPTADAVVANWEEIKRAEKGRASIMDGIPGALPALLYAHKVQRKAATVGFDWADVEAVYPKVVEELGELRAAPPERQTDELGDLLFACVNVARHLDVDAEDALRTATRKFRDRFTAVERLAAEREINLGAAGLEALDALWEEVKSREV